MLAVWIDCWRPSIVIFMPPANQFVKGDERMVNKRLTNSIQGRGDRRSGLVEAEGTADMGGTQALAIPFWDAL